MTKDDYESDSDCSFETESECNRKFAEGLIRLFPLLAGVLYSESSEEYTPYTKQSHIRINDKSSDSFSSISLKQNSRAPSTVSVPSSVPKKRGWSEYLQSNYWSAWVLKDPNATEMTLHRVCIKCKTLVPNSSRSLITHTDSCNSTWTANDENAPDQSGLRAMQTISLDSKRGQEREDGDRANTAGECSEAHDAFITTSPFSQSCVQPDSKKRKNSEW